jgi:hypothetical protein
MKKKDKKDKNKNTTLSEQFTNPIKKSLKDAKSVPLTHIYMTVFYPGLVHVQAPQQKVTRLNKMHIHQPSKNMHSKL